MRWLQRAFLENWQFASEEVVPAEPPYFPEQAAGRSACRSCARVPIGASIRSTSSSSRRSPAPTSGSGSPVPTSSPTRRSLPRSARRRTAASTCACWCRDRRRLAAGRRGGALLLRRLARRADRVYEYRPAMLHAKTMVVDRELAVVGTREPRQPELPAELRDRRGDLRSGGGRGARRHLRARLRRREAGHGEADGATHLARATRSGRRTPVLDPVVRIRDEPGGFLCVVRA